MAEYSKERLYFIKLPVDFFNGYKMKILEAMPNGKDYELMYLKLMCESITHEGYLRFSKEQVYTPEMISALTNTNIDIVRVGIEALKRLELIEETESGSLYITEVPKMIGSTTEGAQRKQEQLARRNKGGTGVEKIPPDIRDIEYRELESREVTTDYANASSSVTKNKPDKTRYKQNALLEILIDSGYLTKDEIDDGYDDLLDDFVDTYGFVDTKIKLKYFLEHTCKIAIGGTDKCGKPIFLRKFEDDGSIANRYTYLKASLSASFRVAANLSQGWEFGGSYGQ